MPLGISPTFIHIATASYFSRINQVHPKPGVVLPWYCMPGLITLIVKLLLLVLYPLRKSVVMLTSVGIMLSLRYVMRACKRRSRLETTTFDYYWRREGPQHVLTSPWTSLTTCTIDFSCHLRHQ